MSLCLAIETSGTHLGLAVCGLEHHFKKKPSALFFKHAPGQQSDILFPVLTKLLSSKKMSRKDISLIVVGNGPGSFTGVRVAVSAARGLAQALDVPIMGISSLEALAWSSARKVKSGYFAAVIPALAGESYFGLYRKMKGGEWKQISAPIWTTDDHVARLLKSKIHHNLHLTYIERPGSLNPYPFMRNKDKQAAPHPYVMLELALKKWNTGISNKKLSFEQVQPMYLQPSWAERKSARK